jgi:uncharacterized protein (TIGR03382 family)
MNADADLNRQQLQSIADYMMLQYGTALFIKLAYLTAFLVLIGTLLGCRRLVLFFFFWLGAFTFLVPSNLTMTGSPCMMALSLAGWGWLTLRRRKL